MVSCVRISPCMAAGGGSTVVKINVMVCGIGSPASCSSLFSFAMSPQQNQRRNAAKCGHNNHWYEWTSVINTPRILLIA